MIYYLDLVIKFNKDPRLKYIKSIIISQILHSLHTYYIFIHEIIWYDLTINLTNFSFCNEEFFYIFYKKNYKNYKSKYFFSLVIKKDKL